MTPKEKAKELVDKFGYFTTHESWQSKNYLAIECALIAVDEILNLDIYQSDQWYWQEVKQEIEKL